eukprot:1139138-Pelagomonas_calceolata.AAC.9
MLPKELRLERCQLGRTYAGSMQKQATGPQLTPSDIVASGACFVARMQLQLRLRQSPMSIGIARIEAG